MWVDGVGVGETQEVRATLDDHWWGGVRECLGQFVGPIHRVDGVGRAVQYQGRAADLWQAVEHVVPLGQRDEHPEDLVLGKSPPLLLPLGRVVLAQAHLGVEVEHFPGRAFFGPGEGSLPVAKTHLRVLGGSRGAEQGKGGDTAGRQQRHQDGDDPALAHPDHGTPGHAERVEQAERVAGQVNVGERTIDRSAAMTAFVHRDQPELVTERRDLRGEHVGVHQVAVQQQHRGPVTAVVDIAHQLAVVDLHR